jgi:hypothetical protein
VRLQVVADQAGGKHTGDSRNRGKRGQPAWPSPRRTVEGVQMRTFGDERVCRLHSTSISFADQTQLKARA